MIRTYSKEDKPKVIALLRKNTPDFFDVSEEKDFEKYLEDEIEDYFVYEKNSKIIGAGGINYFPEQRIARISWDMIDPASQGTGIGKIEKDFWAKNFDLYKMVMKNSSV